MILIEDQDFEPQTAIKEAGIEPPVALTLRDSSFIDS